MRVPSPKRLPRRDAGRATNIDGDYTCELRASEVAHEGWQLLPHTKAGINGRNEDMLPAFLGTCYQPPHKKARAYFRKLFMAYMLRWQWWRRGESNPCQNVALAGRQFAGLISRRRRAVSRDDGSR
jgi:hypothetical protein